MRLLIRLLFVVMLALAGTAPVLAQDSAPASATSQTEATPRISPRQLLVPPKNSDGTLRTTPFIEDPVRWMAEKQQSFYGSLSQALRSLRGEGRARASWTLFLISFAYGVFHAAGPGHGKTVISAWLFATENELRRGITVAFLSSIIQALTAILLVTVLLGLVASAGSVARDATGFLESASYLMIAGLGLYLLATALPRARPARHHDHGHGHSHDHHGHSHSHHDHHGDHADCPSCAALNDGNGDDACGCGHAHAPTPYAVAGADWSWPKALSMAFAIGIRPCTGAILVLIMANALGIYWAGVVSTLAMGFGTFLTVSAIAALAVFGKGLATRLAGTNDRLAHWLNRGLRLAAGLLIAGLGLLMFLGSLQSSQTVM